TRHKLLAKFAGMRYSQGKLAEAENVCRWLIEQAGENELAVDQDPLVRDALGRAYYILDIVLTDTGRVDEATNWKKALTIFEELGDLDQQAAVMENTGTNMYFMGRWSDSIELWERAR